MKYYKFETEKYVITARTDKLTDGLLYFSCYEKGKGMYLSRLRIQIFGFIRFSFCLE